MKSGARLHLSIHKRQTTATVLKSPTVPQSRTPPSETFTGKASIFIPEKVNIVALLQQPTFKCLNKP